jgi:hypothetical protein
MFQNNFTAQYNNMKKILSLFTIVAVVITSCTKEAKAPQTNNGTNSITSSVVTGNFIITKFTDTNSSDDRATDFSGYRFTFNDNGSITVDHNGVISTGSYSEKPAHEGEAAKLTLSFNDPNLVKLSKKWAINIMSDTAIHLNDDDNAAEVLEFSAQ